MLNLMKNLSKTTAKEFKPMTELYERLAKAVGIENIEKDADMSKEELMIILKKIGLN